VQRDGVPLFEHPADDRRRRLRQVRVDEEEGGTSAGFPQHVEQSRRRGGIRTIVVRQINHGRPSLVGHAPHRPRRREALEQEWEGRGMREEDGAEASDDQPKHQSSL
jgi:hypothetical protein